MPIHCNVPQPTVTKARNVARGCIELVVCTRCGHIYNSAFDSDLIEYMPGYENSLHFSPRFRSYATALAEKLIDKHGLFGKRIVEIACGRGEFLQLLCELGANRGLGFDPSYDGSPLDTMADIRILPDSFPGSSRTITCEFVCCRHALEHISRPREFLTEIRSSVVHCPNSYVFMEVPNSLFILKDHSIWDIIYEHCSYFCVDSLGQAFATAGFEVDDAWEEYDGQFLCITARPSDVNTQPYYAQASACQDVLDHITTFNDTYHKKVSFWQQTLNNIYAAGKKAVVWGAGSKGVMFLNLLPAASRIEYVVDVNPKKHGLFVEGSGQQIVPPFFLKDYQPDIAIVMNRIYRNEIEKILGEINVHPALFIA